jgi:hypothetical protein
MFPLFVCVEANNQMCARDGVVLFLKGHSSKYFLNIYGKYTYPMRKYTKVHRCKEGLTYVLPTVRMFLTLL